MTDDAQCKHSSVMPVFDSDAARGMDAAAIQRKWPRFMGNCPECGELVILYASFTHYISGDW